MTWKRKIAWAAVGIIFFVVVAILGGYAYLKSAPFEHLALRKISEAADESIGARTSVGGLDFSLPRLSANLYNITLRGTENADRPPLLQVDKLTVQLKIVSLLHRQFSLRELLVEHPVVHLEVSKDGKNNLPASKSTSGSHTSVFDLAVAHAKVTNGELDYNDRKTPMDADLYDLATDIRFTPAAKKYEGVLSYRNGRLRYAAYQPVAHSFDLKFNATPEQMDVEAATLRVGASEVKLQAEVKDYSNPNVVGLYQIRLHTQDLAQFSPSAKPEGDVALTGKLHYQSLANESFLRSVSIDGRIASEALTTAASGNTVNLRKLEGEYRLADGNLVLSSLNVNAFGGRITAHGEMNHLDRTPDSRVRVSLANISLRALQHLAPAQQSEGAQISGSLSGKAEASWKGSMRNVLAQSDLWLEAQASSTARPHAAEVPINGAVHALYDGRRQSIQLHDTVVKFPTAAVTANGIISQNSALQVQVVANDLHQVAVLAASFGLPGNVPAISGKATVNATVQGSLKRPTIAAELNAQDLSVQGTEWKSATLRLHANPSELSVQNGTLTNARQGQASFSADIKLHNWSYEPSDRIQAQLDARQLKLADLQQLANQHYPVSGELSAKLWLNGTELQPEGTGRVEIIGASAYDEPIQRLAVDFHAENGSLSSTLNVAAKAGKISGNLTYTPKTKAYKLKLDAPSLVLQHLQRLQAENAQIQGIVTASVNGEGTIDDPQLVATVELPELQVKGKSVSEMRAEAHIAQHRLDFNLNSKVSQIAVRAQGQVALTGDYQAQASLDTGTIPLDTLLAAYAPNAPQGFQGETEVHASLRGPLKDNAHVEAHLSIPVLKASYQSIQVGIAKPIRADYQNSVVTLQPADIEGTDTSLHIQGQFPLGGTSAPSIAANGSVDLRILKIVAPDVQSSGLLALDLRVAGTSDKPAVRGQMQLKNVGLTTQDAPIGVEKLNGTLDVLSDRVQISQMKGLLGGGQFSVGGAIAYRPDLHFNLAVQSQSVRLLYPTGLRSELDANLSFSGTPAASTLNGRVFIDSLGFTPDFDLASFSDQFSNGGTVSQPGFADTIKLAIAVQSRSSLNATSSQLSIAGQAVLQVGGTAADPVITGRTTLTSGELFYRNVRYQLQRGVITFDDPSVTRPVFNVSVTTTIEQYNLTLTLRGPLDKLTTSYVSDPPLATADIVNLVARGKTTQESAASSQSTDSMIASQAVSQLSSSVQKLAGISSLQIDPTLGGNGQNPSARIAVQQRVTKDLFFTFSTDVSQPGSEMVQGEYQINQRWSVSVTRDQLGGVSVDGRYHTRF